MLDSGLDVGDQGRQGRDRVPNVVGGAVHGVEQRAGLSQRRFRGVYRVDETALLAADRPGRQLAGPAEVLVGEGQPVLGRRHVGGHRSQCRGVELVVQLGHSLLSRCDARGQVDDLLGQSVQSRRRVDHQIAHFLEGLPLRLQLDIGPRRGDDHLGQQFAPLRPGFRYRVVELLTHGERLGQSRFGVVDCTGERLGSLFAELLDGQRQLVGAGADRVVDVDDLPPGQVVERAQRQCRQRIGVGGVDPFRRGQLGGTSPAAPVSHEHVQSQHRDQDHAQPDQQRRGAGRLLAPVESVGRRDRRAAPVAAAQRGFDLVASQIVDLTAADRLHPVRHQERVGMVDGRHGEYRVEIAQIAGGSGVLRPAHCRLSGEIVDEDHPQLDVAIGVQLAGGRLNRRAAGAIQCAGVVGDVAAQAERRLGGGRGRHEQSSEGGYQHRHEHGDRAAEGAHDRQSSPAACRVPGQSK